VGADLQESQDIASEQVSQFGRQSGQSLSGAEYEPAGQVQRGVTLEFY
jgi:hypothetical protein